MVEGEFSPSGRGSVLTIQENLTRIHIENCDDGKALVVEFLDVEVLHAAIVERSSEESLQFSLTDLLRQARAEDVHCG